MAKARTFTLLVPGMGGTHGGTHRIFQGTGTERQDRHFLFRHDPLQDSPPYLPVPPSSTLMLRRHFLLADMPAWRSNSVGVMTRPPWGPALTVQVGHLHTTACVVMSSVPGVPLH